MACCGEHRKSRPTPVGSKKRTGKTMIYPAEGCVLCAEKHISTAFALAGEAGYIPVNRQRIIGELTACALHLFREHKEISEEVRTIRHAIQQRKEAAVKWDQVLKEIDELATVEASNLEKEI